MRLAPESQNHRARLHAPAAPGFTLIELLVVVAIIGIVTLGILLSTSLAWNDRELETESERLLALTHYVREQAELQTREFGLYCDADGYEFLAFDPRRDAWRSVSEDETMRARTLPEGLRLRLLVEGREIVLQEPTTGEERRPHVMIFSSGDLTPFELTLEREGARRSVTLASTEEGQIELQPMVESGI